MKKDEIKGIKLRNLDYDILYFVETVPDVNYGQPKIVEVSVSKIYTIGNKTLATVYYEYTGEVVEDVPIENLFEFEMLAKQFIRINQENIRKALADLKGVGELFNVLDGKIKLDYRSFYTKELFHRIIREEFNRRLNSEEVLYDEE